MGPSPAGFALAVVGVLLPSEDARRVVLARIRRLTHIGQIGL